MEQEGYLLEITWGSAILSLDLGEGDSLPLGHRAVGKEKVMMWRCFLFVCRDQEGIFMEREVSQSFLLFKTSADGIMIVRRGEV